MNPSFVQFFHWIIHVRLARTLALPARFQFMVPTWSLSMNPSIVRVRWGESPREPLFHWIIQGTAREDSRPTGKVHRPNTRPNDVEAFHEPPLRTWVDVRAVAKPPEAQASDREGFPLSLGFPLPARRL